VTSGHLYGLSFWASGESAVGGCGFGHDGIFGLDLTGNSTIFLAAPSGCSNLGSSHVYEFTFVPTGPDINITFTNWGHFGSAQTVGWTFPDTTELVLDDVILYDIAQVPEPGTFSPTWWRVSPAFFSTTETDVAEGSASLTWVCRRPPIAYAALRLSAAPETWC
jgi:hypothetical protein